MVELAFKERDCASVLLRRSSTLLHLGSGVALKGSASHHLGKVQLAFTEGGSFTQINEEDA